MKKQIILTVLIVILLIGSSISGIYLNALEAEVSTKQVLSGDSHLNSMVTMHVIEHVRLACHVIIIFLAVITLVSFTKTTKKRDSNKQT